MGLLCSRSKADRQVNPAPCSEERCVPQATSSSSKAANVSSVDAPKEISVTKPDFSTQGDRTPTTVAESESDLNTAKKPNAAPQTTTSQSVENVPPAVEDQRVKNVASQSAEDVAPVVEEQRVQNDSAQSVEDLPPAMEEQGVQQASSQSEENVPPVVEEQRIQNDSAQSAENVLPAVEEQTVVYTEVPELPALSHDTRPPEVFDSGTMPNSAALAKEAPEVEGLSPRSSAAEEEEKRIEPVSSSVEKAAPEDQTPSLLEAVENDDWAAAENLLAGAGEFDPNARTDGWGYSVLRAAAEEGAVEVCRLLIARRADVNARDPNGMTPLMGCVTGGDVGEIVTMLLEAKADATATTDDDFTALKWATRLNHEVSISLLRAAGLQGETSCF